MVESVKNHQTNPRVSISKHFLGQTNLWEPIVVTRLTLPKKNLLPLRIGGTDFFGIASWIYPNSIKINLPIIPPTTVYPCWSIGGAEKRFCYFHHDSFHLLSKSPAAMNRHPQVKNRIWPHAENLHSSEIISKHAQHAQHICMWDQSEVSQRSRNTEITVVTGLQSTGFIWKYETFLKNFAPCESRWCSTPKKPVLTVLTRFVSRIVREHFEIVQGTVCLLLKLKVIVPSIGRS